MIQKCPTCNAYDYHQRITATLYRCNHCAAPFTPTTLQPATRATRHKYAHRRAHELRTKPARKEKLR